MDNLHEIAEENLKEDMKKTFGLLVTQDPSVKFVRFVLVSALNKDNQITNVIPNPEILRLYALDEEDKVKEWTDMCLMDSYDMLLGVLLSYSKKWKKMKVVFTTNDFKTIEHFIVENPSLTRNK